MQLPVALLGCVLAIGSTAVTTADFSNGPVESPQRLQLGRLYLSDDTLAIQDALSRLNELGVTGALQVYRPALERDPGSAYRWVDVGGMLDVAGDRHGADYCYRRAEMLAPHEAAILFQIGNYDFTLKNIPGAVQHFSRVLAVSHRDEDTAVVRNVFGYYERMKIRDLGLLDSAVPDAFAARVYLTYLTSHTDPSASRRLWQWMHSKGYDDNASTISYLRYMFAKRQLTEASEDWHTHVASGGYSPGNAIFNGGFEKPNSDSPFDWSFDGYKNVTVTRDEAIHHDGNYSIKIEFSDNDNPEFSAFRQFVVVPPGRYQLDAYLKTAEVTSSEGVRVAVNSGSTGVMMAETEALKGTHDFTPVTATFDVPSGTPMVVVRLTRHRALRIDNQLKGKAWLDSVSLTRVRQN